MGGRLEHAIRLLPQVLACSTTIEGDIVVLADPSANARAIQTAVERVARDSGAGGPVRIIGPSEPIAITATRSASPLGSKATIATVAAIGVGTLLGGLTVAGHHSSPSAPVPMIVPSPAPGPLVTASAAPVKPLQTLLQQPGAQTVVQHAPAAPTKSLPVEVPDLARAAALAFFKAGPRREARATHPGPPKARTASPARPTSPGHAGRGHAYGHRKGKHLPTWSEAYLPPHPGHQEGSDLGG